jgi:hypothetical protein
VRCPISNFRHPHSPTTGAGCRSRAARPACRIPWFVWDRLAYATGEHPLATSPVVPGHGYTGTIVEIGAGSWLANGGWWSAPTPGPMIHEADLVRREPGVTAFRLAFPAVILIVGRRTREALTRHSSDSRPRRTLEQMPSSLLAELPRCMRLVSTVLPIVCALKSSIYINNVVRRFLSRAAGPTAGAGCPGRHGGTGQTCG